MPAEQYGGAVVYVMGAAGALGAGVAGAFQAAGAAVIGVDRTAPEGDRRLAGAEHRIADATDDASVAAVFRAGPPPWAVVNTVGGFAGHTPLSSLDPAELAGQLELNLVTAAIVTKHALRAMAAAGEGRLVHTSSQAAARPAGAGFSYSVSKAGVAHLVAMAADETRGTGVTVNCVSPSIIDTPANRQAMPDADHAAWPKIGDIARAYLFLASPGAHLVNGAVIPV